MRFFGKQKPDDVPGWAMNMSPQDFERFLKDVERSIRKHNRVPIIHREEGFWTPKENPKQQMGLHNLVQLCAQSLPTEWQQIIDKHMRITLTTDLANLPTDWESVKDKIKLRLLPLDTQVNFELIEYPICAAFRTVIAIDHPESVALPKSEQLDEWPIAKSQLYDLALQNIWEQDMPEKKQWDERSPQLIEFEGQSFFTASHLLLLDRHFPSARNGVLAIAPARDVAFVHPIEDLEVAKSIGILIRLADDIYRRAPGPVTPRLLWWRNGVFTDLPWEPVGEQINFTPPPEFVEVLNSLSG